MANLVRLTIGVAGPGACAARWTHGGTRMNAAQWVKMLDLAPHPEGGYFRRTSTSGWTFRRDDGATRPLMTAIYYLLTADRPLGKLHRNQSDIIHFFHSGDPIVYWLLFPDGRLERHLLGPDPLVGHRLQLTVPGGIWKASVLEAGDHGLISEAVAPGFDPVDREMADAGLIERLFPAHWPQLSYLVGRGGS